MSDDDIVIIPVNKDTLQPPGRPQQIFVGGTGHRGFLSKEVARESIEVNLIFEEDEEGEDGPSFIDAEPIGPEGDLFTVMGIPKDRNDFQTGTSTYISS